MKRKMTRPKPNNQGAPKHEDRSDALLRIVNEKILITESGVNKNVPVIKAIVLRLHAASVSGNIRASKLLDRYRSVIENPNANRVTLEYGGSDREVDERSFST